MSLSSSLRRVFSGIRAPSASFSSFSRSSRTTGRLSPFRAASVSASASSSLSLSSRPTHQFHTSTFLRRADAASGTETKQNSTQSNGNGSNGNGLEAQVKQLSEQLAEKDKKISELQDKWMRTAAEVENVRRIGREDASKATKYGVQAFAKSMLTVADELDLAIHNFPVKADALNDPAHKNLKDVYDGLVMTRKSFHKGMAQHGVVAMEALGTKFDANMHDAIFQMEAPNKEPGSVGEVLKQGYMLNDRVLRPASVGVVKK